MPGMEETTGRYSLPVHHGTKAPGKRGYAPSVAAYLACFAAFIALDHGLVAPGPVRTLLTMLVIATVIAFLARRVWLRD